MNLCPSDEMLLEDAKSTKASLRGANARYQQKSLQRASIACVSCRARRVRCIACPGQVGCKNCLRDGKECLVKNDDERRRRCSRQYVDSLTDRIEELEALLEKQGSEQSISSAQTPARTFGSDLRNAQQFQAEEGVFHHRAQPTMFNTERNHPDLFEVTDHNRGYLQHYATSPAAISPVKGEIVERLTSTRGYLSTSPLDARLRYFYFGPTTNARFASSAWAVLNDTDTSAEQDRRAHRIINSLPLDTHDYLMDLFWEHFNCSLHVSHRAAFNEDRENGRTQFYSCLLHICQLAMGYRFANKNRADIKRITLSPRESVLHQEAKYLIEHELEQPGGLPTISALLLLGELECGVGRDNFGWMLHSMAVRLVFDLGLHLDMSESEISERETEVRSMTLWACVIYDQYWALFSRRPTNIKIEDIEIISLRQGLEKLGTCRPAGPDKSLETHIYEALLDVMEIASKITDQSSQLCRLTDRGTQLRTITLDRELHSWHTRLGEDLKLTDQNATIAPASLFLLHQQYHSALILLHWPFTQHTLPAGQSDLNKSRPISARLISSVHICKEAGIAISKIYQQYQLRFDIGKLSILCLQHAGTAATAMVAALACGEFENERIFNMHHLQNLYSILRAVSSEYRPADLMANVLQEVIIELQNVPSHDPAVWALISNGLTELIMPGRRERSAAEESLLQPSAKRRETVVARAEGFELNSTRSPGIFLAQQHSQRTLSGDAAATADSCALLLSRTPQSDLDWTNVNSTTQPEPVKQPPISADGVYPVTGDFQFTSNWASLDVDGPRNGSGDTPRFTTQGFGDVDSAAFGVNVFETEEAWQ